jgi:hypothetical protein
MVRYIPLCRDEQFNCLQVVYLAKAFYWRKRPLVPCYLIYQHSANLTTLSFLHILWHCCKSIALVQSHLSVNLKFVFAAHS